MSQVRQLYRLQQIDSEISKKKQRLGEVLRLQKETEELIAAKQRVETAVAETNTWQSKHNNLNLEIGSLNSKAKRSEQRLYSGNVKNPKELADLQKEIQALGRQRNSLEDIQLEALIMLEDAQAEQETAESLLKDIQTDWEASQRSLKTEQNSLAIDLHKRMGVRQQMANRIDAKAVSEYDRLRERKGGTAVAGFKLGRCQGCRLTISANKEKRVERGEKVYCGSCGRMLCKV